MSEDSKTSLLSHCTTCQSKCCHNDLVVMTDKEHERIIAAGHDDHCHKITIRNADYYILDYSPIVYQNDVSLPCPYLGQDKRCSIENEKPHICKSYPMRANFTQNRRCPAVLNNALTKEFIESAIEVIAEINKTFDSELFYDVYDTYIERKEKNAFRRS